MEKCVRCGKEVESFEDGFCRKCQRCWDCMKVKCVELTKDFGEHKITGEQIQELNKLIKELIKKLIK